VETRAVDVQDVWCVVEVGVWAGVAVVHVADDNYLVGAVSVYIHDIRRPIGKVGPRSKLGVAWSPATNLIFRVHVGGYFSPIVHVVAGMSMVHLVSGKGTSIWLISAGGDGIRRNDYLKFAVAVQIIPDKITNHSTSLRRHSRLRERRAHPVALEIGVFHPRIWVHIHQSVGARVIQCDVKRQIDGLIGIDLVKEGNTPDPDAFGPIAAHAFASGMFILNCGPSGNIIRFIPPLNVSMEDLDTGIDILIDAVAAYEL